MKNFFYVMIIFTLINLVAFHYYDTHKYDFSTKNRKYKYSRIHKDTLKYIKNLDKGSFYNEIKKYPKVFLYINIENTGFAERQRFQKIMSDFEKHEGWAKGYHFAHVNEEEVIEQKYFKNVQVYHEYMSFHEDCEHFCIINFDKKALFSGTSIEDKYLFDIISSFYQD